jgi:DNA mismatch repair protein MutS
MTRTEDLHIEKEILPLFDFTRKSFSQEILSGMLKEPLLKVEDIVLRQAILKGFIANQAILKDYSYSRTDMYEVHRFLEKGPSDQTSPKRFRLKLLFSENQRHQTRAKYIQAVLLFHKLQNFYFSRLNTKQFPEAYAAQVKGLNTFLSGFNLSRYELLIREQHFKVRHIVELSGLIAAKSRKGETGEFWKQFFLFEAYLSISFGMTRHNLAFPSFSEKEFSLCDFYHPLVKNAVTNSFNTQNNVILITGPNMSGKSTLLKAVSLCVYLGHLGLGVPAKRAVIPFFDTISIKINHSDDILSGYSHFMTEVISLKNIVSAAADGQKCFAVFDELFIGTNIEDAIEISSTSLKGLTKFKDSMFFISTHLHQLKEMDEVKKHEIATWYIDCELNGGNPSFTYKLKEGWSDIRVGRLLFEKEGLNALLKK